MIAMLTCSCGWTGIASTLDEVREMHEAHEWILQRVFCQSRLAVDGLSLLLREAREAKVAA